MVTVADAAAAGHVHAVVLVVVHLGNGALERIGQRCRRRIDIVRIVVGERDDAKASADVYEAVWQRG